VIPSPSQHDTSSPLGEGFGPFVVPHAYRTAVGAGDPVGSELKSTEIVFAAVPMVMCTGTHVVFRRTAVAESATLDLL
jgi:hypothetical protein